MVPPDFILDLALEQMGKTRQPASEALVVQSLARRTAERGWASVTGSRPPRYTTPKSSPRSTARSPLRRRCVPRPRMMLASGNCPRAWPIIRSR
ncbi:hypothetical protein P0F65_17665 [Sphingomonas sp. I4]